MSVKITVHEIPPSNNKFIGRNARWQYGEEKKRWEMLVRSAVKPQKKPFGKAVVRIAYFFPDKRRRDPDNFSGKFILDGLTRCGVIADDSFDNIQLELSGGYDKKNPRTEIEVEQV